MGKRFQQTHHQRRYLNDKNTEELLNSRSHQGNTKEKQNEMSFSTLQNTANLWTRMWNNTNCCHCWWEYRNTVQKGMTVKKKPKNN